jgi:hypothetical protein
LQKDEKTPFNIKRRLEEISNEMATINEKETSKVVHRNTLEVSGLPVMDNLTELHQIENALFALFEDYLPESIHLLPGSGLGFVKVNAYRYIYITILLYYS